MALIALVAIPGLPVAAMLLLVFLTTLANPPSQAARSALLPLILPGDRVVLGLSINQSTGQAAQVVGYAAGAGLAAVNPRRRHPAGRADLPGVGVDHPVRGEGPAVGHGAGAAAAT